MKQWCIHLCHHHTSFLLFSLLLVAKTCLRLCRRFHLTEIYIQCANFKTKSRNLFKVFEFAADALYALDRKFPCISSEWFRKSLCLQHDFNKTLHWMQLSWCWWLMMNGIYVSANTLELNAIQSHAYILYK